MDSQTIMTGVFGYPVGHSISPNMQNAAFQALGLNFAYAAFAVSPQNLGEAVRGIKALEFRGVNVTIPHKVAVMEFLDEIEEEAADIGAVNTIMNENGRLTGYNTDGRGYVRSLLEEWKVPLTGKRVVMIGAGGAARAVAVSLARQGAGSIQIANRTLERAEELARHIASHAPAEALTLEQLEEQGLLDTDLLINTTSIGMYPNIDASPVPAQLLHEGLMVSDLIYNPIETRLLAEAKAAKAMTHDGVGMFVHQGALAFQLWTGREAPTDIMRKTTLESLQRK